MQKKSVGISYTVPYNPGPFFLSLTSCRQPNATPLWNHPEAPAFPQHLMFSLPLFPLFTEVFLPPSPRVSVKLTNERSCCGNKSSVDKDSKGLFFTLCQEVVSFFSKDPDGKYYTLGEQHTISVAFSSSSLFCITLLKM